MAKELVRKLSDDDLETFLDAIAERGASRALERVGLHDENAGSDLRDMRDLLRGYRVARKAAWNQLGRIIGVAVTVGLITFLFSKQDALQILSHLKN